MRDTNASMQQLASLVSGLSVRDVGPRAKITASVKRTEKKSSRVGKSKTEKEQKKEVQKHHSGRSARHGYVAIL